MDNQPQPTKSTDKALWIVLIIVVLAIAGCGIYALVFNKDNENTNNANAVVNQNSNVVANSNIALNQNTNSAINGNANQNVNAENTNGSVSANQNSNTSIVSFTKGSYDYTNQLKNSFTNVTYYIRKATGEQFCGVNGSGVCELVRAETNGSFTVVANLFFKETPKTSGALQGASLLTFSDANTLIIKYASGDHGGSSSSVYAYNLKTKNLQQKIVFIQAESSTSGTYGVDYYQIEKDGKKLVFVNNSTSTYTTVGIFTVSGTTVTPLSSSITTPFTVVFDVAKNYQNNRISLLVNNTTLTFDFLTLKFE